MTIRLSEILGKPGQPSQRCTLVIPDVEALLTLARAERLDRLLDPNV